MSDTSIRAVASRPYTEAEVDDGSTRTALTAWAGIAASIVGLLLVFAAPGNWPALAGALLLVCAPAGAAIMCWIDSGDNTVQAGLTLILSLAVTAIASALMIWLATWHPDAMIGLSAASVVSCIVRLSRGTGTLPWRISRPENGLWIELVPLIVGLGAWAYGVSQVRPQAIGPYGLLASANVWFFVGFVALLGGGLFVLSRPDPRTWLLGAYLVGLIFSIHATVPILFGVPEYPWVYKHIGVVQALGQYGRVVDPSDIYQQWPALFAAVALVSGLSHVGPLSYAAWAPFSFELADVLLLLGIFRLIGASRRVAFVALFMYEGLVAWVGQDYLSPQAFSYLLWLGMVAILIRWWLSPAFTNHRNGILARVRAPFLSNLPGPRETRAWQRVVAGALAAVIYFVIVAAHQLTPYLALAGVGALVLLGLLRRGWLVLFVMALIAGGYLLPRFGLISQQFGGLFSGGNVLTNASGVSAAFHNGAEARTAEIVRVLAIGMWLLALAAIARQWRTPGRVVTVALLAFSPFFILLTQNYGGEAIYRVFMFSAPWCALLIAGALVGLRSRLVRWLAVVCVCFVSLAAGLQGLYGPVAADAFVPAELTASLWLYDHAPHGSLFALAADDFPMLEAADYNSFNFQIMPADPQLGQAWLNESSVTAMQTWITSLGYHNAYVVVSRSMAAYGQYFGYPHGFAQLENVVRGKAGWSMAYHDAYTTIYRVHVG